MFGVGKKRKANDTNDRAESIAAVAQKKVTNARNELSEATENFGKVKLEIYGGVIKDFVDEIGKIKEIDFRDNLNVDEKKHVEVGMLQIREMSEMSIKASDMLKGVVTGAGAGVLSGMGAFGLVSEIGIASTGTAIAELSGAAATNATLAWLGGGAIAAGGGGVALGTVVLGGIVALPALLIASGIMDAKGQECLNVAKGNLQAAKKLDSDANVILKQVEVIKECISQNIVVINELKSNSLKATNAIKDITQNKNNWNDLSEQEKSTIFVAFKTIQLLKKVIEVPLLDRDGNLTEDAQNINNICKEENV